MLLDGKLLITGVLTDDSIAYAVARVAQEQGAEILLTNVGKGVRLTERVARLPSPPDVMQMDVNTPEDVSAVADELTRRWGRVDGVLHGIAFAPQDALGGNFLTAPWESVSVALQTSAYSLKALTVGLLEPLKVAGADGGASVVSLTFDGRVAWPIYDWMGVAKAGLEATTRYLARDLGEHNIRVNTVSAGPIRTMAGKSIPGFDAIAGSWATRAPLAWSLTDATPVGQMLLPAQRHGADDDRRDDPRRRRLPRARRRLQDPGGVGRAAARRTLRAASCEMRVVPSPATEVRRTSPSGSVQGAGRPDRPTSAPVADPTVAPFESVSCPAATASEIDRPKSPSPTGGSPR